MGRNYYCDYCDKRMKNDVQIRKKHIDGMPHKTARNEYYAKFKDAKEILKEELVKSPCTRFFSQNYCHFGAVCRFSHYTPQQICNLQQIVNQNEYNEWLFEQPKQFEENLISDFLNKREKHPKHLVDTVNKIWNYLNEMSKINESDIPPSLQQIDVQLIPKTFSEWG